MGYGGILEEENFFFPENTSVPQNEIFPEGNFEAWEKKIYHADNETTWAKL